MRMKDPKAIAMYLPQFYETEYNNLWWGKGFTDWVSMSRAKPLFYGHYQPRIPLGNNMYNLLEKKTMLWQAQLMKKYGIYGLCFYHYWFKNEKRVLELPAENLLQWKDVDIPFCFCWANESWVKSWSNVPMGNVWSSLLETENENTDGNGILLEQSYGNSDNWKNHLEYLIPFFKDERYIKIDNKPVFIIYRIDEITCIDEMLSCWNELVKKEGFDSIYIIGRNYSNKKIENLNADFAMEPILTIHEYYPNRFDETTRSEVAKYISYDELWKHTLERESLSEKTYWCGCVGYDSTPRRGRYGGVIFNNTPEKFKIYLTELIAKSAASNNEFFFINAWNEWGEGMYLEPDEKYQYGYLEAFTYAYNHYEDEKYKYMQVAKTEKKLLNQLREESGRYLREAKVLNQWLYNERNGNKMEKWLWNHGYHAVGVYGLGFIGKQIVAELERNSRIRIIGIDKNAEGIKMRIDIYTPEQKLPKIDIVIVSNMHLYNDIKKMMMEVGELDCEIKSLDMIVEMMKEI